MVFFTAVIGFVVLQRLAELAIAHQNGKRMLQLGAFEAGAGHYPFLVLLHTLFIVGLIAEVASGTALQPVWWWLPFSGFVLAQALRVWCIYSLGVHWNTRVYIIPGMKLVERGPYRWLKHPNYLVVTLEIMLLPLAFGAYWTMILASLGNLLVLQHRIRIENGALSLAARGQEDAT